MSQAPAYDPQTDFSSDENANVGGRSTIRTDRLDAELDNVSASVNALCANLALLQRDDGLMRDALVQLWNLSASCRAALVSNWTARGLWATATAYVLDDMVDVSGASYICARAHTSGVFATDYAAGKWQIFVAASTAGGIAFTPTTNVSATTVQAAIEEVDTESRATSQPMLASLYGAL